jgi:protein associated with RNAse G/E
MRASDQITVRVLKRDRAEYRRWRARIAEQDDQMIVLDAEFDAAVSHHLLGRIEKGTRTVEYYWLDRWYNVFRFLHDDGRTRLWYCNVNTPPILEDGMLTYIDLDIDVLVSPDLSYQVLDLDEFAANAGRYGYSSEERAQALAAVEDLISLIKNCQFPFQLESSSVCSVVNVL